MGAGFISGKLFSRQSDWEQMGEESDLQLEDGSRVAVIGAGPAGSFFSYFLVDMAERVGLEVQVDMFEAKDFGRFGPVGCNHCGGIISESLVQILATDGINLPSTVVQRGIDSYVMHTDAGHVRIETPLHEKRIAAVYRGSGPRGTQESQWSSFDAFLQRLAVEKGVDLIPERVDAINWVEGRPQLKTQSGLSRTYDLAVGAVGVNTRALEIFAGLEYDYQPPQTTQTYICEFPLGRDLVQKYVGNAMHVFLLDLPRLEFAALIPKGDNVTVCLLGREIDKDLVQTFLDSPEVKRCLPPDWHAPPRLCHCAPRINIRSAVQPYRDRMVMIGDCGVTKLFKDGIGAAYRTAKAAATTAVFEGIASADFQKHYEPVYRSIETDNAIGKAVFAVSRQFQKRRFACRAMLDMAAEEQEREGERRLMSGVLWDTFTGSASYRDIALRFAKPDFFLRFLGFLGSSLWRSVSRSRKSRDPVELLKSI